MSRCTAVTAQHFLGPMPPARCTDPQPTPEHLHRIQNPCFGGMHDTALLDAFGGDAFAVMTAHWLLRVSNVCRSAP